MVCNGNQELVSIKIDPDAVDPSDVAGLEDLVAAALRKALESSKALRKTEMSKVTGGLNLPGMGF